VQDRVLVAAGVVLSRSNCNFCKELSFAEFVILLLQPDCAEAGRNSLALSLFGNMKYLRFANALMLLLLLLLLFLLSQAAEGTACHIIENHEQN
jgi:hypothetical protein